MASLALTSNARYSSTVYLSSFILGMQSLCKELFHPAKFCLHCSYAYEVKAAFLLENGKHESGAWVAVSFSQQLARVSPEGPSLSNFPFRSPLGGVWLARLLNRRGGSAARLNSCIPRNA